MNRKRGMFGHAKVSSRVFYDVSARVTKGIQDDVDNLFKTTSKNPPHGHPIDTQRTQEDETLSQSDSKWDTVLRTRKRQEISKPIPGKRGNTAVSDAKKRKLDMGFKSAAEVLRERNKPETVMFEESLENLGRRRNRNMTTISETPSVFKSPKMPKKAVEAVFPPHVDMEEVVNGMVEGLPFLPLKNDQSTTYLEANTDIFKKALSQFFNLDTITKKTEDEIRSSFLRNGRVDPRKEMLNCTGPLNVSRKSLNSTVDQTLDDGEMAVTLHDSSSNLSFLNSTGDNDRNNTFLSFDSDFAGNEVTFGDFRGNTQKDLSLISFGNRTTQNQTQKTNQSTLAELGLLKDSNYSMDTSRASPSHHEEMESINKTFDHIDKSLSIDGSFQYDANNSFVGFAFENSFLNNVITDGKQPSNGSPTLLF